MLIEKLSVSKLEDRDSQEVDGYFEALDLISDAYDNMPITETTIKSLHNLLLKHSLKDGWHKVNYKQHNNAVEATRYHGSKYVIFETTPPGFPTEWRNKKAENIFAICHIANAMLGIVILFLICPFSNFVVTQRPSTYRL